LRPFAGVTVATTDGYALSEFATGSFDLTFGQGVLGYLPPNQLLGLLSEIRRVLSTGGVSVFNFLTIDDADDAATHLATVLELARRRRPHGGVDQAYTLAQLEAMHAIAGLAPVVSDGAPAREPGRGRIAIVARRSEDAGESSLS
ncbi:MAG: class I SAM-dependent methyltransferase, partial [Trebonia sp.]